MVLTAIKLFKDVINGNTKKRYKTGSIVEVKHFSFDSLNGDNMDMIFPDGNKYKINTSDFEIVGGIIMQNNDMLNVGEKVTVKITELGNWVQTDMIIYEVGEKGVVFTPDGATGFTYVPNENFEIIEFEEKEKEFGMDYYLTNIGAHMEEGDVMIDLIHSAFGCLNDKIEKLEEEIKNAKH